MSTSVMPPVIHYICNNKCGEILMTPNGENFQLICDFCTKGFVELIEFIKHIRSQKCLTLSINLQEHNEKQQSNLVQQVNKIDAKELTKVFETSEKATLECLLAPIKREPLLLNADEQYQIECTSSVQAELAVMPAEVQSICANTSWPSLDEPLMDLQECTVNQIENNVKMDGCSREYDWKVEAANFNDRLIEEVRKHECLYDLSKKDYRNVQKKYKIWREIGATLHTKDNVCRKRWKSLRDTYKRQMRSEVHMTGSGAHIPNKKWKFAEAMSFLNRVKDSDPILLPETQTIVTEMQERYDIVMLEEPQPEPLSQPQAEPVSNSAFVAEDIVNFDDSTVTPRSAPKYFKTKLGKKRSEADVRAAFVAMMEKCCEKLGKIVSAPSPELKSSTLRLFESLAHKITSAALSEIDIDAIEARVLSVVYEEIMKRRQAKAENPYLRKL